MPLAMLEAEHLVHLIDELGAVIAAADETPDSGVSRLTPSPYPDDAEASADFAAATRDDLLDRRTSDAAVVRSALAPHLESVSAEFPGHDPDEMPTHIEVVILPTELDAWLRTLTALRLVIATRLEITTDDDVEDADDPRFGVFHWLGYRLDLLITVADALDEISADDTPTAE